ncbi:MAG: hypothetical protein SRB2_02947 [Desulfobacteraceae bacterium Eth-SRB2]|nr:MAG: hypothetical protein SRB2_02947 [Desulfobacteraceae bacterium Eth-SRB2]
MQDTVVSAFSNWFSGIPIAVIGLLLFVFFFAPILMPGHTTPTCDGRPRGQTLSGGTSVPPNSPLVGQDSGPFLRNDIRLCSF